MHRNICGCMDKKCRELTEQYFNDPESKYPDNKKQLLSRSSFSLGIPIQMVLTSAGSKYATLLPSCLVSKIQRWMLAVHGANDMELFHTLYSHTLKMHTVGLMHKLIFACHYNHQAQIVVLEKTTSKTNVTYFLFISLLIIPLTGIQRRCICSTCVGR
jgi:hypothetical protein